MVVESTAYLNAKKAYFAPEEAVQKTFNQLRRENRVSGVIYEESYPLFCAWKAGKVRLYDARIGMTPISTEVISKKDFKIRGGSGYLSNKMQIHAQKMAKEIKFLEQELAQEGIEKDVNNARGNVSAGYEQIAQSLGEELKLIAAANNTYNEYLQIKDKEGEEAAIEWLDTQKNEGAISTQVFNRVNSNINKGRYFDKQGKLIEEKINEQAEIIEELTDNPYTKTLDKVQKPTLLEEIYGINIPENADELDLNALKSASFEEKARNAQQRLNNLGDKLESQALDFENMADRMPTLENAKKIYNEHFKPNFKYNTAYQDQQEHRMGLAGNQGGSAREEIENDRQKSINRQDLQNIFSIQHGLDRSFHSETALYDHMLNSSKGYADFLFSPIEREQGIRNSNETSKHNQDVYNKDLAEGKLKFADSKYRDEATIQQLNDSKEDYEQNINTRNLEQLTNIQNEIRNQSMSFADFQQKLFSMQIDKNTLFLNISEQLKQMGYNDEAQNLKTAMENNKPGKLDEIVYQLMKAGLDISGIAAGFLLPTEKFDKVARGVEVASQFGNNIFGQSSGTIGSGK